MKREDKELLIKDLCARLYYGVKVTTTNPAVELGVISGISIENKISVRTKHADIVFDCTEVKPYLRPMSSMTEEESKEYRKTQITKWVKSVDCTYGGYYEHRDTLKTFDWLIAHHFDYRRLIEKGLAIEVTEENNPYNITEE